MEVGMKIIVVIEVVMVVLSMYHEETAHFASRSREGEIGEIITDFINFFPLHLH